MTRGTGGRDHFRWVNYRANVYSTMRDTPKKGQKSLENGAGAGLGAALEGRAGAVCARPRASIGTSQI